MQSLKCVSQPESEKRTAALVWFYTALLLLKFALMSWDSRADLAFYAGFTQTLQRKKKKRSTTLSLLFPLPGVSFLLIFIYLLPILELSCVFLNYQEMAAL